MIQKLEKCIFSKGRKMRREVLVTIILLVIIIWLLLSRQKDCSLKKKVPIVIPSDDPNCESCPECPVVIPCGTYGNLSELSHSFDFGTFFIISGDNWAYDNYILYTYTFDDDTPRPNGGYLFLYDAPSDTIPGPGPGFANTLDTPNQGLKIIDYQDFVSFPNGHEVWLPFNVDQQALIPTCYTSPDNDAGPSFDEFGNGSGYRNRTIGITEWFDATNVNFVDNGTSVDVTWDPIPGIQEYAVSVTFIGTATEDVCFLTCIYVPGIQFEFGKIVPGNITSTNVPTTQVSQGVQQARVGFWNSVESIEARVVGYALCNKSTTINGCAGVVWT